jgi:UDP-2,3-diacylglucosamine pyrophosphatase LpxH
VRHARWLALLGDGAYTAAIFINTHLNIVRRKLGLTYWSLSSWAKMKVKNAVNYISRFEELLAAEAKRHEADGVICGHIHHAAMHDDFGVRYVNTGDWVESRTAIVEHYDGSFQLIRWTEAPKEKQATPSLSAPAISPRQAA